jgi:hypothetical protein
MFRILNICASENFSQITVEEYFGKDGVQDKENPMKNDDSGSEKNFESEIKFNHSNENPPASEVKSDVDDQGRSSINESYAIFRQQLANENLLAEENLDVLNSDQKSMIKMLTNGQGHDRVEISNLMSSFQLTMTKASSLEKTRAKLVYFMVKFSNKSHELIANVVSQSFGLKVNKGGVSRYVTAGEILLKFPKLESIGNLDNIYRLAKASVSSDLINEHQCFMNGGKIRLPWRKIIPVLGRIPKNRRSKISEMKNFPVEMVDEYLSDISQNWREQLTIGSENHEIVVDLETIRPSELNHLILIFSGKIVGDEVPEDDDSGEDDQIEEEDPIDESNQDASQDKDDPVESSDHNKADEDPIEEGEHDSQDKGDPVEEGDQDDSQEEDDPVEKKDPVEAQNKADEDPIEDENQDDNDEAIERIKQRRLQDHMDLVADSVRNVESLVRRWPPGQAVYSLESCNGFLEAISKAVNRDGFKHLLKKHD